MTATDTAAPVQTKHMLTFRPADTLIRALSNALLFAGDDDTLAAIAAVRFEFDGQLRAVTTNRYQLCIETVATDSTIDYSSQPHFEFLLPRAAAKAALAMVKTNRHDPLTLLYDSLAHTIELRALSTSATYETNSHSTFPAYRSLLPKPGTEVALEEIGFTPAFLADLAKVQTENTTAPAKKRRGDTIAIKLYGKNKPVTVQFADGPFLLIMPVRLAS